MEAVAYGTAIGAFLLGLSRLIYVVMCLRGTEPKDRPGILLAMRGGAWEGDDEDGPDERRAGRRDLEARGADEKDEAA